MQGGKVFVDGVEDTNITSHLLLGGEKTLSEVLLLSLHYTTVLNTKCWYMQCAVSRERLQTYTNKKETQGDLIPSMNTLGALLHITILYILYILESNPRAFYSLRGLKNWMRIRIECGLDSQSRAGFWKNDRAGVRAVRTIQLFIILFIILYNILKYL
jgi:hypothetical protein